MAKSSILLEAGTNEMELLVFHLGKTGFGINVAKVREIIQRPKTVPIPYAPPAVEGSFRLRDEVLTLISLGDYFDIEHDQQPGNDGMVIVVEFNQTRCGVLVDSVDMIYRLRWDQIESPSAYLAQMNVPITGVAKMDDQTVQVLDFETIIGELLGVEVATDLSAATEANLAQVERSDVRIVVADDSSVLRLKLKKILTGAGFTGLTVCSDGQQAWETLQEGMNNADGPCDLVLTDVEMPRMDGLHLTARIKETPELRHIPVILFSSLITPDNRRKGESVGADAQVSKPDSDGLLDSVLTCLAKTNKAGAVTQEPKKAALQPA